MTETTNTTTTPSTPTQANPFDKTILLSLTVKMLGVSRKVSTDKIEADADKELLRVSKKILECDEYNAITATANEIKKYLRARCVPGAKFIKNGIYAIPLARVEDIDQRITEEIQKYNAAVTRFLDVYEIRSQECRARLSALGDLTDYPSVDKVKASFGISTEYITLGPPSSLANVSKELYMRESAKIRAACVNASEQVQDAMRTMFSEMVSHMVDSCTPKEDGKPKKFYDTTISNIKEFLDNFADRNITDDADLQSLVEQTRSILAGKSANAIRKDMDMRSMVAEDMAKIKSALDSMLKDKPERNIIIDE